MEIWESIVLGALQGLTEFLPVSSSGHLELANYLFGIEEPNNLTFTMAVHAGTVLSTIVVFWRELGRLIRGFFRFRMSEEMMFVINIFVSLLPIMFVGLMFGDQIAALFTSNLALVGSMLLVTAALLTFSHYAKPKDRPVTMQSAFIMGLAQAVAVIPGLSRSGATISAGLMQGVRREEVSKFSFLMVLIPIIGMNLLEAFGGGFSGGSVDIAPILVGFVTAFATGLLACRWMIRLVNRGKLVWFAVYCVVAGLFSLGLYFFGS
ncbi:undecaprenyl-diphosphate phosphatase [Alistipes sp. OttesenSCG-928-B03]|nr:undecaprenyl-diphosphate phosphatase [Alistipes sp. OttesenSCG-928-B03]